MFVMTMTKIISLILIKYMQLKYILDDYGNFAIFSPVNTHSDMARGFYKKPVSAGFCTIAGVRTDSDKVDEIRVQCYGKSISLNLDSREQDGEIISNKINNIYA